MQFIALREDLPTRYRLLQNIPNPFNASTTIWYGLPRREEVEVSIYNVQGQRIWTLSAGMMEAGWYKVNWDGKDEEGRVVSSGVYVVEIRTERFVEERKVVKVK